MSISIIEKELSPVLFEDFCDIVAQRLKIDRSKLIPSASWVKDIGISSVDLVKIVILLRQKFGVIVKVTQAGKIKTVQDAYQLVSLGISHE